MASPYVTGDVAVGLHFTTLDKRLEEFDIMDVATPVLLSQDSPRLRGGVVGHILRFELCLVFTFSG